MNLRHIALASVAAIGIAAVPAKATAQIDNKLVETIAAIFLADKLGLDSNAILATSVASNASVYDLAPAYQMYRYVPTAQRSRTSAQSIHRMRQSGMGWGEIAKRLNMHPGEFNKLRNSGALDSNVFWRNQTQNRFSLNQSQVNRLREMGFNWRDITNTTIIAREAGVSIFDVANRYRQYRNWDTVARGYDVNGTRVAQRVNTWRTSKTMPTQWRTVVVKPGTGWRTSTLEKSDRRAQPIKRISSVTSSKGKSTLSHGKSSTKVKSGSNANKGSGKIKVQSKSHGKATKSSNGKSSLQVKSGAGVKAGGQGKSGGKGKGRGKN